MQHLKQAKRYSVHTLCAYKNDLDQLSSFLADTYQEENIFEAHTFMIRSWMVDLINKKASRTTLNRKRSSLKSFFRYAMQQGVMEHNPMDKIPPVRKEQQLPVFVEEEKLNKLLDQPLIDNSFESCRDHLVLLLLYTTGIRLSELTELKTSDLDLYNRTIKVHGKGNKERILPLLDEVVKLLKLYSYQKEAKFGKEVDHRLLVTNKGKVLYPKFVYSLVNSYLSLITTLRKKSPHVLRHSFATHMLNNGADLNAIKEILGHASLSATQVYTHNSFAKIRNVYKQAHPKA